MLKKKMIASSIANLTDARYFAGWMVDYIVFNIDPHHEYYIDPQSIGTFQSWVEGPKYILQMSREQYPFAEKYLVDFDCQAVLVNYDDRAELAHLDIDVMYSISLETLRKEIQNIDQETQLIINGFHSVEEVESIFNESKTDFDKVFLEIDQQEIGEEVLLHNKFDGYMVHGSPEEKVGLKSFDELDEIFELLQDF